MATVIDVAYKDPAWAPHYWLGTVPAEQPLPAGVHVVTFTAPTTCFEDGPPLKAFVSVRLLDGSDGDFTLRSDVADLGEPDCLRARSFAHAFAPGALIHLQVTAKTPVVLRLAIHGRLVPA